MIIRYSIAFLLLIIQASFLYAQSPKEKAKAVITFAEDMRDYGDIVYGDSISYTFKFTNTGTADLVIKNVVTTCSCTSRKYTEGPIAPGQTGELIVSFDSNKQDKIGRQNKVITILSNAENNPERVMLAFNILEKGKR
jgi:hypothetical protein